MLDEFQHAQAPRGKKKRGAWPVVLPAPCPIRVARTKWPSRQAGVPLVKVSEREGTVDRRLRGDHAIDRRSELAPIELAKARELPREVRELFDLTPPGSCTRS